MSKLSRVVWGQGIFLQPQHFQQMERSLRAELDLCMGTVSRFSWGCASLEIERSGLRQNRIALAELSGRFPDGTVFSNSLGDPLPDPVLVNGAQIGAKVYVGVPLGVGGQAEFVRQNSSGAAGRFEIERLSIVDATDASAEPAEVEVGRAKVRLLVGEAAIGGYSVIPLAVIEGVDRDGSVRLSESFVPTVTVSESHAYFRGLLKDIHSRVVIRSRSMAGRSVATGRLASAEHFLEATTLMALNRYAPLLDELTKGAFIHPYELYLLLVSMAGELSTFGSVTEGAISFDGYRHDDLCAAFSPVVTSLYRSLGQVLADSTVKVPIEYVNYGLYVGRFEDAGVADSRNRFILSVTTDLHPDDLRGRFASIAKVAPPGRIKEFVKNLVSGVGMRQLSSAPPEVRFPSAKSLYFELDSRSSYWSEMQAGVAIHVADEFAGLRMELWVIRHAT